MSYYSPLFNFFSDIQTFQLKNYLEICQNAYNLQDVHKDRYLSKYEEENIIHCKYWIKISDTFPEYLKPSFICNTLLLALWVHKPNQIETRYRFGDDNSFVRQLDRFQFIRVDDHSNFFSSDDLILVKTYYNSFCRIIRNNKRLYIAQLNTFRGCLSHHWAVAFLLFSAAFEALLNYGSGYGLTKRLSKANACLMETKKRRRDSLYNRFYTLYNIRSDIMHGRHMKWKRSERNLKMLSELSSLLRQLWQKILTDKSLEIILEKDDITRKDFFKNIQKNYSAPY